MCTDHHDSWPWLTYRYVEHYFWEPQHLLKAKGAGSKGDPKLKERLCQFYKKIQTQEVPLNYLFNVFLRIVPQEMKYACLSAFQIPFSSKSLSHLQLRTPRDEQFVQPDIVLESDRIRIFIEVKVRARIRLEQVQKYIFLHAQFDEGTSNPKSGYVLFLTKNPFHQHWSPAHEVRGSDKTDITRFLRPKLNKVTDKLRNNKKLSKLLSQYHVLAQNVTLGAATWQQMGEVISKATANYLRRGDELGETVNVIASDFLDDLECRELWKRS